MAIDFPSSPTNGQRFTSGNVVYVYNSVLGVWAADEVGTALPFNYAVNGSMHVSQQNSATAGTTNSYFAADQTCLVISATGTASAQWISGRTPRGSAKRVRITVTATQASIAAGNWFGFTQPLEGQRCQAWGWGAGGSAKKIILRFGFKGPAGTWSVCMRGSDRSYATTFTITAGQANTDTEQVFAIPGCTDGTWPIDNTRIVTLWISLAAGTTYITTANDTWVASGTPTAAIGISNGLAALSTFELFDLSFYVDTFPNTNRPPVWEAVDECTAMRESQRYWYKVLAAQGIAASATVVGRTNCAHPTYMRGIPTSTVVGTVTANDATSNAAMTYNAGASSVRAFEMNGNSSGMTIGRGIVNICNSANYIAQDARV